MAIRPAAAIDERDTGRSGIADRRQRHRLDGGRETGRGRDKAKGFAHVILPGQHRSLDNERVMGSRALR